MAIYSTIFLCDPQELLSKFPSWKTPLPEPVIRKIKHPFTQEEITINTREPEWDDNDPATLELPEYKAMEIQGDYQDYLEQRIPPTIRSLSHWSSKNLTMVELNPLVAITCNSPEATLESALFAPPPLPTGIERFPEGFPGILKAKGDSELRAIAEGWAATMSTPEHTHSVSGDRIHEDWTVEGAFGILQPIFDLAKQQTGGQAMYMLYEG